MMIYTFRKHIIYSLVISVILWFILYLGLSPSQWATVKGTIQSVELVHSQMIYGYDLLFSLSFLFFGILLILYKPIRKIKTKDKIIKTKGE